MPTSRTVNLPVLLHPRPSPVSIVDIDKISKKYFYEQICLVRILYVKALLYRDVKARGLIINRHLCRLKVQLSLTRSVC